MIFRKSILSVRVSCCCVSLPASLCAYRQLFMKIQYILGMVLLLAVPLVLGANHSVVLVLFFPFGIRSLIVVPLVKQQFLNSILLGQGLSNVY